MKLVDHFAHHENEDGTRPDGVHRGVRPDGVHRGGVHRSVRPGDARTGCDAMYHPLPHLHDADVYAIHDAMTHAHAQRQQNRYCDDEN